MTLTLEPKTCSIPARRRALPAAPVLIRVPALAETSLGGIRPPGRRRLRREVRLAGCWLIALIPPTVACATWGNHRPSVYLAVNSPDRPTPVAPVAGEARPAAISLSLAPVGSAQPSHDLGGSSVFLSGQLLPAEPSEEPTHGGY